MRKNIINKFRSMLLVAAAAITLTGALSIDSYATVEETTAAEPVINVTGAVTSCTIDSDKQNVTITITSQGDTTNTDGNIYLFELKPYEDGVGDRTDYLTSFPIGTNQSYSVPLGMNTSADKTYDSFLPTVWNGFKYVAVGSDHAITNPEMITLNNTPYQKPNTKKGLAMELNSVADAVQLGAKHASVNIAFNQMDGQGIDFEYDGETYHFDSGYVGILDRNVKGLSGRGITVTSIILNGWNPNCPDLFLPGTTETSKAAYYLFNVSTEAGFKRTRATAAFLAERYDGKHGYGKISNWIIGNEINSQYWNYVGSVPVDTYTRMYEKVFRVFYTALKTSCSGNRVFFSLDYNWNNPKEQVANYWYGGKEIVDIFNATVQSRGQMDWGLAYHSYSCPMTEPEFWDDDQTGLFTEDSSSPVINFKNLHVLTDYFQQTSLLNAEGQVRPIILTEAGFTATSPTRGDVADIQAAAFAYSYYLVDSNPYIDLYILGRQIDAPAEVASGLSFGLWACDMNQPQAIVPTYRRKILGVYGNIDNPKDTLAATEFAKSIIGINKWSDVVPNFKWASKE